ncbi:uncharacterized protein LAESUDRAFT_533045 [Laetiporus sulphureus 93-53]|uniref:Uncharacterized protein n=1 Tax=Laetiporus sulphureus 93-53 TaxID=1314785 RepID=A0A165BBK8_9APHY|nr:uncharacterized protein LAESUDRAFT_533045 [Laetiporus sulphureus 93-53]KZT00682.1 hypothetical protein LAESUDRAFT_533045 [Laetiporus sulphureus 93-53]
MFTRIACIARVASRVARIAAGLTGVSMGIARVWLTALRAARSSHNVRDGIVWAILSMFTWITCIARVASGVVRISAGLTGVSFGITRVWLAALRAARSAHNVRRGIVWTILSMFTWIACIARVASGVARITAGLIGVSMGVARVWLAALRAARSSYNIWRGNVWTILSMFA